LMDKLLTVISKEPASGQQELEWRPVAHKAF
jgi:hypothetical protein